MLGASVAAERSQPCLYCKRTESGRSRCHGSKSDRKDPSNALNYYNLTIALDQTGTLREERVALHDTLQRDASYTPTHNQMGLLNMKEVQQAAGRKRIGEGDFFGRALCRSKNNLGVLMRNKGDGVRAEALFRQTITERPGYAQAMTNLGSLLASEGQMAEADDLLSKVIESNLANVAALSEEAMLLMETDQKPEAIADFRTAVNASPQSATMHVDLGIALADTADHDGARCGLPQRHVHPAKAAAIVCRPRTCGSYSG